VEAVTRLGGEEIIDEIGGGGEADAVAAQARELADGVGKMSFAHSRRADEDAIGLVADEVERGGTHHEIAVDGLWVVEVERIEGGEWKDSGALQSRLSAFFELDAKLLAHEVIEERGRRVVTGDGLAGGGVEERGGVMETEGAQHLGQ
jgi:hypothetical protein